MPWVICFFVGLVVGGAAVFAFLMDRHKKMRERERASEVSDARAKVLVEEVKTREAALRQSEAELHAARQSFERQIISYRELESENAILKRDLQNIDVNLHKLQLDTELFAEKQRGLDERSSDLARRYLKDTIKAIASSLNPNNYAASRTRLVDAIGRCRDIGFNITKEEEERYVADLKAAYELVVRAALEREEQARIRAQIREEEKLRRELEREQEQTERERVALQALLDKAMSEARDKHSEEVERLKVLLAEAEAKSQRALSMAQQTKAGNVYVISNIGTFGSGVFKVGMTRRLEPLDRVRELGDASVPFPFDVHMMISCDDAPALENALHRALHKARINRVNPRKEFFRTSIQTILGVVRAHQGDVQYVADPEALEYNQSLAMSDEDAEFVEAVYDAAEAASDAVVED